MGTEHLRVGSGPQSQREKTAEKTAMVVGAALDHGEYPSDTARQIFEELLPEWQAYFLEKNLGYGDMADDLGPRAQFVDMHRKVGKLRRALWEDQDIGHEGIEEVAQDLIGHCFLLLRQLRPRYAVSEEKPEW